MQRDLILDMLSDACGKKSKSGMFEFSEQDKASLLMSTDGPVYIIEEISRVEVKDGFAAVRAGRSDMYLVQLDRIVGLKVQRTKREGAGFLT